MNPRHLLIPVLLFAAACGGDLAPGDERPAAEVVDSAGITVVQNARPADDQTLDWIVSGSPLVSIGALEGPEEYQLYQVRDARKLPDGRLLVANDGTKEVRVYDSMGNYLDSWGGEGEGPGEFTGLRGLHLWPGDSIMAWDWRQRRLTVYDMQGNVGRSTLLEPTEEVQFPQLQGVFDDGTMLMTAGMAFSSGDDLEDGVQRNASNWVVVGGDGSLAGTVGEFPGNEAYLMTGEGFISVSTLLFARGTRGLVWNGEALIGTNDTYELRSYDRSGALNTIIRRDHDLITVTQQHFDAASEEQLAEMDEDFRDQQRDMHSRMPLVPNFPAYGALRTDALGNLWVEEYDLPGEDSNRWTVYDPTGRVLGFVQTPPDLTIYEIGEDYILGRATDDFDIEYVQMFGLMRNDPAGATQE